MYNESYISLGGTLVTLPDNTKQFNAMDNIGSVRLTVSIKDENLSMEHFDYKPFGDTLNAEGESRIGYAAQERDEESRYFAMGARQYDPLSGRFLSVDPLYESFPDKTPYHYCNNNPISFKDPSGLSPEGEKGKEDEVQAVVYPEEALVIDNSINDYAEEARQEFKMWSRAVADKFYDDMRRLFPNDWGIGGGGGGGGGARTGLSVKGSESAISKFQSVVNTGTGGHYRAEIDKNGQVTMVKNDDGEMTNSQQAFYDVMAEATDRSQKGVTIELIEWGDSKGRDHYVLGGALIGLIDVDDVIAFGDNGIMTSASVLGHEIAEQTVMQRREGREGRYQVGHRKGCMAEGDITGYKRVEHNQWGLGVNHLNEEDTGWDQIEYYDKSGRIWKDILLIYKGNLITHFPIPTKKNYFTKP